MITHLIFNQSDSNRLAIGRHQVCYLQTYKLQCYAQRRACSMLRICRALSFITQSGSSRCLNPLPAIVFLNLTQSFKRKWLIFAPVRLARLFRFSILTQFSLDLFSSFTNNSNFYAPFRDCFSLKLIQLISNVDQPTFRTEQQSEL